MLHITNAILTFFLIFSLNVRAEDNYSVPIKDCNLHLKHSPSTINSLQFLSPSKSMKALVNGAQLLIQPAEQKDKTTVFDLSQHLPHRDYLQEHSHEISWSPDEKTLILIPHQNYGQGSFNFFVINLEENSLKFKTIELPRNSKMDKDRRGLYLQPERVIWLPKLNKYALRVNVITGRLTRHHKEVLLVFDSQHHFKAAIGYNMDEGYQVGQIYQNRDNPQIIDINFYHFQYTTTYLERWDLNQDLKISSDYLYQPYKNLGFQEIDFAQNPQMITPELEDRGKAHHIRSPNGRYWLELSLVLDPEDENQSPEKAPWALDVFARVPSNKSDSPFKINILATIPMEIDFENLKYYWHHRGEALIVRTNDSQIWLWNYKTRHLEVFAADDFEVQDDELYLYLMDSNDQMKITKFSLVTNQVVDK